MEIEPVPTGTTTWAAPKIYAANDPNLDALSDQQQEQMKAIERMVMFYLPRICNHCLNPSVRSFLSVRRDVQARGGRHRPDQPGPLPRLALVHLCLSLQEDLLQLVYRQVGEVHPVLPAPRGR